MRESGRRSRPGARRRTRRAAFFGRPALLCASLAVAATPLAAQWTVEERTDPDTGSQVRAANARGESLGRATRAPTLGMQCEAGRGFVFVQTPGQFLMPAGGTLQAHIGFIHDVNRLEGDFVDGDAFSMAWVANGYGAYVAAETAAFGRLVAGMRAARAVVIKFRDASGRYRILRFPLMGVTRATDRLGCFRDDTSLQQGAGPSSPAPSGARTPWPSAGS